MRLAQARIRNYRSILDTGVFDVEKMKTILVGANEAGKTAILQALQHINRPADIEGLEPLRDFPRSKFHEIRTKAINPSREIVVEGWFSLDDDDKALMPPGYEDIRYRRGRYADDEAFHSIEGGPNVPLTSTIAKDVARLVAHLRRTNQPEGLIASAEAAARAIEVTFEAWPTSEVITKERGAALEATLKAALTFIDESEAPEEERYERLTSACGASKSRAEVYNLLWSRTPTFVLFNNYLRVKPRIQLNHLASRVEQSLLDDKTYDYGNLCLLKLIGFSARELSDLASKEVPAQNNPEAIKSYQKSLDERQYQLNAASVQLTTEIRGIWAPDESRGEAAKVRIVPDGQYLKMVVEDSIGVEVELDQRSEGFQWLVSFFVIFFAEAEGQHRNAILLLDEPGVSLHGLKQREFRSTLSKLSERNQTVYTTHSPFLVGPDELDLVRVVEMKDRATGTKVSKTVAASDSPALLPLQEALGYDMAQSLFAQQRNLVLEGLTDYWYVDATSKLFDDAGEKSLEEKVALVPAGNAGKVVYFATILHAQKLRVAALLDSDSAGDQAAKQDTLTHTLGQKAIMRTKDFYKGTVQGAEVEDLLRETLIDVGKEELGWDVAAEAAAEPARAIVDIFQRAIPDFSKYRLAKAYLRWTRTHSRADLKEHERDSFAALFAHANKVLK
jgi:predicted ATPase